MLLERRTYPRPHIAPTPLALDRAVLTICLVLCLVSAHHHTAASYEATYHTRIVTLPEVAISILQLARPRAMVDSSLPFLGGCTGSFLPLFTCGTPTATATAHLILILKSRSSTLSSQPRHSRVAVHQ